MAYAIDNKKIAKNTVMLYVRTGITMIISFFTARVTLQVLGIDDYGLNNLVGSVVLLFSFLNSSMGAAVQRFFNIEIGRGNDEHLGKIYGVGLYLHIIVAVITVFLAEIFAVFFLEKMNIPLERMTAAKVVFQISIFSMALNIINVPNFALLKAREMFSETAMIEIVQALLRLVVLYLLFTINYDKLIIYSLLNLGVTLYYVVSLFVLTRRFPEAHHLPYRDKYLIREMLKFISLLTITVLAEVARMQGLVILINLFFGLVINAAYAIASQVSNMVNTFVINIKQPIIPQMMAAYGAGDKKSMFSLIDFGTKITCLMMMLITLPIVFEIDFILNIWLKTYPKHTSNLVILVLININISSFTYFLYQGVHATGNITKQQIWMSSLYLLNIALIYLSFEVGAGFYFALYITIFISLCQCLVNIVLANKYYDYGIRLFLKNLLLPCFSVAVIVAIVLFLFTHFMESSVLRAFIVFILGVGLCCLLGYYLILNKEEKAKAIVFVSGIISKGKHGK